MLTVVEETLETNEDTKNAYVRTTLSRSKPGILILHPWIPLFSMIKGIPRTVFPLRDFTRTLLITLSRKFTQFFFFFSLHIS